MLVGVKALFVVGNSRHIESIKDVTYNSLDDCYKIICESEHVYWVQKDLIKDFNKVFDKKFFDEEKMFVEYKIIKDDYYNKHYCVVVDFR